MKETRRPNKIIEGFEKSVFGYGLFLSVVFRIIRTAHEFLTKAPLPTLLIGILNLLLLVIILRIYRKHYRTAFIVFYGQILITSIVTWESSGGWNGVVPYILIIIVVAIVITSHGMLRTIALLAYGITILFLGSTAAPGLLPEPGRDHSILSMEFDFFVSVSVLILITLYLKTRFFAYRKSVQTTNARLERLSETLAGQTHQLNEKQAELNAIKDNLEAIATTKVREVKTKARVLDEYAFINGHQVRGPLARVLGLIRLIELETPQHERSEAFGRIKAEAEKMDAIIQRINEIIG